jgi:hypothetical protein
LTQRRRDAENWRERERKRGREREREKERERKSGKRERGKNKAGDGGTDFHQEFKRRRQRLGLTWSFFASLHQILSASASLRQEAVKRRQKPFAIRAPR